MTEGEVMAEKFDRDLELVKLQIAANDCLAGVQTDIPLYFSGITVFAVFGFSVMMQYPASVPTAKMFVSIAMGFVVLFGIVCVLSFVLARRTYRKSIRKLDVYVEDFRAGKALPSVTTMCGLKEKKVG